MKNLIVILLLIISISAKSQILPDSIVIIKYTYVCTDCLLLEGDFLFRSETNAYIKKEGEYVSKNQSISQSKVKELISEINNPTDKIDLLVQFGIDTTWIKNNPEKLLQLYSNPYKLLWNRQQKEYIFEKLIDLNSYKQILMRYLSEGGYYSMHEPYRQEFVVQFYYDGSISNQIKSRRYVWGYQMPWVNLQNDTIYNPNIEVILKPYTDNEKIEKPLSGNKLLEYLTNELINNNWGKLYNLSAYSYLKEIEELKTNFTIVSYEEVFGSGRYVGGETKTIKITLKNKLMFPNVYLQFLASQVGTTIYSRDSIKKDYKKIVDRVQSITFIKDYLKNNPEVKLDIYYFNNSGINQENIESVNKNPTEWKEQDDYIESLKWYEKNNIKPSFDIDEAIKTSERIHCGCNYRFDNEFIKKAIFFELSNSVTKDNSIWFLLPDNTVLLYLIQGSKVLDFDYDFFGESKFQYPCVLFTKNGKIIERK